MKIEDYERTLWKSKVRFIQLWKAIKFLPKDEINGYSRYKRLEKLGLEYRIISKRKHKAWGGLCLYKGEKVIDK